MTSSEKVQALRDAIKSARLRFHPDKCQRADAKDIFTNITTAAFWICSGYKLSPVEVGIARPPQDKPEEPQSSPEWSQGLPGW